MDHRDSITWDFVNHASQLGGIRTGSLDAPQPLGGNACRVALLETGAGLSCTVALDRGGDIIDATFNGRSLAWLSGLPLAPGSFAYHKGIDWLRAWPGGLLTTCGPMHVGPPQTDNPNAMGLHGHHTQLHAAVLSICNPDAAKRQAGFELQLQLDDQRVFGPHLRTLRRISGSVGVASITVEDTIINLGDTPAPHQLLYHVNLGYPLVSPGARLVIQGKVVRKWGTLASRTTDETLKQIPGLNPEHVGAGEGGLVLRDIGGESNASPTVGIVSADRETAFTMNYDAHTMEQLLLWQHFSQNGYVCGVEPLHGLPTQADAESKPEDWALQPGQSRSYRLTMTVASGREAVDKLLTYDGPLSE